VGGDGFRTGRSSSFVDAARALRWWISAKPVGPSSRTGQRRFLLLPPLEVKDRLGWPHAVSPFTSRVLRTPYIELSPHGPVLCSVRKDPPLLTTPSSRRTSWQCIGAMGTHEPLGDLWSHFHHQPLTARDVMVFRIMRDAHLGILHLSLCQPPRDMDCLEAMLHTCIWRPTPLPGRGGDAEGPPPAIGHQVNEVVQRYFLEYDDVALRLWLTALMPSITAVCRRPLLGTDETRLCALPDDLRRSGKLFEDDMAPYITATQAEVDAVRNTYRICEGGAALPKMRQWLERGHELPTTKQRYMTGCHQPCVPLWPPLRCTALHSLRPPYTSRHRLQDAIDLSGFLVPLEPETPPERGRNTCFRSSRSRTRSEPDTRAFGTARLPLRPRGPDENALDVVYKTLATAEIFRRTRSRSLSPRYIRALFEPPAMPAKEVRRRINPQNSFLRMAAQFWCDGCRKYEHVLQTPSQEPITGYPPAQAPHAACANCADTSHPTSKCRARCGFCGAPNPRSYKRHRPPTRGLHGQPHTAPRCPVVKRNRCKCVDFPQFHVADRCPVLCSRDCGNPHLPGSPKHRNAMTCKSRCCMCGLRGHSGRDCRQQSCRCRRGRHLGQDCCWKPACRVDGCDRYRCGIHCRRCGSREKPFVDWRCGTCSGERRTADAAEGGRAEPAPNVKVIGTPSCLSAPFP